MIELVRSAFNSKLFLVTSLLLLVYVYLKKVVYSYWKRHGVPYEEPSLLLGSVTKDLLLQKITLGNFSRKKYEKYKHYPFYGAFMFLQRTLVVNDPDLLKNILIKDFSHFVDRGMFSNEKVDPLTGNLFQISGEKWKTLRTKCSVYFTSSRLKKIFPILTEITDQAVIVADESLSKSDTLELKDLLGRIFIDITFSVAFGFNSNTVKEPHNICRYYAELIAKVRPMRLVLANFVPIVMDTLHIPLMNTEASNFFIKLFDDMMKRRKSETLKRNDFLELLINLMENEQILDKESEDSFDELGAKNVSRRLTRLEATAQAFVFLIAGYETSSSTISFALLELCLRPDIQEKLHKEIDEFCKSSETFNFETLMSLPYLDMVFNETLRKHPVLPVLNRICVKDYQIPNTNYIVPKGMRIMISVPGIHNNPDYYPEPEKFDPTRFSKENVANRHPCTYLPFGIGPRYCIGKRLGIFQSKLTLFILLRNYKFSLCEKSPLPLKYSLKAFVHTPDKDVYLRVEKKQR